MVDRFDVIRQKLLQFRGQRDWARYHDPKNLAEAISIESSELLEKFYGRLLLNPSRSMTQKYRLLVKRLRIYSSISPTSARNWT